LVYPVDVEGVGIRFRLYPGQNVYSLIKAGLTRKKRYVTYDIKSENQYDPAAVDFKTDNEGLLNASLSMFKQ
jgi:hypothetical protein